MNCQCMARFHAGRWNPQAES